MSDKSEAVQLADMVDSFDARSEHVPLEIYGSISAELRRLHEVNQELLEVLRECELFVRTLGLDSEPAAKTAEFARAAIAKATGETT